jgi:hypothetical protein
MKNLFKSICVIAILFAMNGCKKIEPVITPVIDVPYNAGAKITTSIAGRVTNQNGDALNGVEIAIGSSTVITDANGKFIIAKATVNQKSGLIKATKVGYFGGSRTIVAKEKVINNVVIELVKKTESGNFSNAAGGTITVASGGNIVFPANAVVTKSGAAYSGSVKVAAYFLDPTSKSCSKQMPGDLRGINTGNNEQILTSYGMMAVELNGSNGEALQLATGKTASLTFPVVAAIQAAAPATIPLWFFDETKGMWVEQGSATKVGNNYVGSVSHFTWWNCDAGASFINYKLKIVDQNGNAVENALVTLQRTSITSWIGIASGVSASDGTLNGLVPNNEKLDLKIYSSNYWYCTTPATYTATVGPFAADADGGTIAITIPNLATTSVNIKGIVNDCSGNPVASGYAIIHLGTDVFYDNITNGAFDFTKIFCSNVAASSATVDVVDLATLKQNATPIAVNVTGAGTFNVGTVQACGVQNFVRYTSSFVDANGMAITNGMYVSFGLDSLSNIWVQNGMINAIIPANKLITRKIYFYNICNGSYDIVDSTQIGPFQTDFNAGTITVSLPQTNNITISGTAKDCSNNNVFGIATIKIDGNNYSSYINNGNFSIAIARCNINPTTATINVEDTVNKKQNTTPVTINVGTNNVNVGNIVACGINTNVFFTLSFSGKTFTNPYSSKADVSATGATYLSTSASNATSSAYYSSVSSGSSVGSFATNFNIADYTNPSKYYTSLPGSTITFTEFGSAGQYIAGTFSGTMIDSSNLSVTTSFTGSFRTKRN